LPISPPPVPQSGSTPPCVCLLSAAFVTSACVRDARRCLYETAQSFFFTRRAPRNQLIHVDASHFKVFPSISTHNMVYYHCLHSSPSVQACVHSNGSMYEGTKDGPGGITPSRPRLVGMLGCIWPCRSRHRTASMRLPRPGLGLQSIERKKGGPAEPVRQCFVRFSRAQLSSTLNCSQGAVSTCR